MNWFKKINWILVLIIIVIIMAVYIDQPNDPRIDMLGIKKTFKVVQGLDLKGGTQLTFELDLSKTPKDQQGQAIESVKNVLERRINALGTTEPVIQTAKIGLKEAVKVELPGVTNTEDALKTIGKTALLEFKEQDPNVATEFTQTDSMAGWKSTELTGAQLKRATTEFDPQTNQPIIGIEFNDEGKKLFGEITARNINKPIAIFLDDQLLSSPNVNEAITGGSAVIQGQFTLEEVKKNVNLLNSGALPVPLTLSEQRTIGATLGDESVKKSITAGLIGLLSVAIFMIIYYRFLGIVAVVALTIYTLISLAIFKFIPVTLTLSGIAGFILSIGMAVDANILIFERMKEELRARKSILQALDEGFKRAWSSIRDSNVSSIITALILLYMMTGSVRGFALTLLIGIIVSMFSAITVSRTLLNLLAHSGVSQWLRAGIKLPKEKEV